MECNFCGEAATSICGACKTTLYCSEQCQKHDFASHQPKCDQIGLKNPFAAWQQNRQAQNRYNNQQQQQQQLQALMKQRNEQAWYVNSFKQGLQSVSPNNQQYQWFKTNYDHNLALYNDLTRQIVALGGR